MSDIEKRLDEIERLLKQVLDRLPLTVTPYAPYYPSPITPAYPYPNRPAWDYGYPLRLHTATSNVTVTS